MQKDGPLERALISRMSKISTLAMWNAPVQNGKIVLTLKTPISVITVKMSFLVAVLQVWKKLNLAFVERREICVLKPFPAQTQLNNEYTPSIR